MKAREFCHWLQGCFELNPGLASLSPKQAQTLSAHLALVAEVEAASGASGASSKFCGWLQGFLQARELIDAGKPIDGAQLDMVKAKLDDAFRLDIDPAHAAEVGGGLGPQFPARPQQARC